MRTRRWRTFAALAGLALSACDAVPVTAPRPSIAPASARAYLVLPSGPIVAGSRVTVQFAAPRPAGGERLGSYIVRIAYDSAALRFVRGEGSEGGMVLAQATAGRITLAGASPLGFPAALVGGITLDVNDPSALGTLTLEIVELTTTSFLDPRAATLVDVHPVAAPGTP